MEKIKSILMDKIDTISTPPISPKDKKIAEVFYIYPAVAWINKKSYEESGVKHRYLILERTRKDYKVGFFTTKEQIDGEKIQNPNEEEREKIWKVLGNSKVCRD